ncbi:MAG TPA: hypothetical protein VH440_01720 [Candidatus Limnocylindrales bacterium]
MVAVLLSVTFACGLFIAGAHVLNRGFVAPVYDVAANLVAFGSATGASLLLSHWFPAALSAAAIGCWLVLARRTYLARRAGRFSAHQGSSHTRFLSHDSQADS